MLRTIKDDEGCDSECSLCGRHLLTGRCFACGYVRLCCNCGVNATETLVNETHENGKKHIDLLFMCKPCADYGFELQNDDARTA